MHELAFKVLPNNFPSKWCQIIFLQTRLCWRSFLVQRAADVTQGAFYGACEAKNKSAVPILWYFMDPSCCRVYLNIYISENLYGLIFWKLGRIFHHGRSQWHVGLSPWQRRVERVAIVWLVIWTSRIFQCTRDPGSTDPTTYVLPKHHTSHSAGPSSLITVRLEKDHTVGFYGSGNIIAAAWNDSFRP